MASRRPTAAGDDRDRALFFGDLPLLVMQLERHSKEHFLASDGRLSAARVTAALATRAILLTIESFEGWVVSISRWLLQAASTSGETTHMGPITRFFEHCRSTIDPGVPELLERARTSGVSRRVDVARALVQCAAHHDLWHWLVEDRGAKLTESNRFGYTPLHFAAGVGSAQLVETFISLGADVGAKTRAGATPLHIAAGHSSINAAQALARQLPSFGARAANGAWSDLWLDHRGRSPEDIALETSGPDTARCALLLRAVQPGTQAESAKVRKARCSTEIATRSGVEMTDKTPRALYDGDDSWEPNSCVSKAPEGRPEMGGRGSANQRCDILIVDGADATTADLAHQRLAYGAPVLVRSGPTSRLPVQWRANWTREALISRLGSVSLPLETYPYSTASASLVGVPTNLTTIGKLLQRDGPSSIFRCPESTRESDLPRPPPLSVFKALKGWSYVGHPEGISRAELLRPGGFGEGGRQRGDIALDRLPAGKDLEADIAGGGTRGLLAEWTRPRFIGDESDVVGLLRTTSIQFYIGGTGAGAQPHWHGPAWNWLARGKRKWLLWPPEGASYAQRHVSQATGPASAIMKPLVCEQHAGDVVLLPALWGHATLNLAPSIGFATELQLDRTFDLGFGQDNGNEWWRSGDISPEEVHTPVNGGATKAEAIDAHGQSVVISPVGSWGFDESSVQARQQHPHEREVRMEAGSSIASEPEPGSYISSLPWNVAVRVRELEDAADEAARVAQAAVQHAKRLRTRADQVKAEAESEYGGA
jgi:hypothetical protein